MELKIDKQLAKIDATWMGLVLEYEPFKQRACRSCGRRRT